MPALSIDTSDWGCDTRSRRPRSSGRRAFLKNGALALIGTSAVPAFLTRGVLAEATLARASNKKLVVLFQRGAADGLNLVVPYTDPHYAQMRPNIGLKPADVLDLDGRFGLHPALASFKPLFDQGHLAIVHAAGSPDSTRSHFDAQDFMESGTPGLKSTPDGWLNRALLASPVPTGASAFRAVALGSQVPRTLQGRLPAIALSNLNDFSIGGRVPANNPAAQTRQQTTAEALRALYDSSSDTLLHGTADETFDAVRMLKSANPAQYTPAAGVIYPSTPFGNALRQTAQLLKANLGVEAAFADIGGWDTHQNQGAAKGQLANRLREFSQSIAAFWQDMGPGAEDITLVTMSEFGRTARENGTGGTDHGHANVMFVLGGNIQGGKVYGQWPGLAPEQLNDGRDLAVTTDYRRVLGELTTATLGAHTLASVFPGTQVDASSFLRLTRPQFTRS